MKHIQSINEAVGTINERRASAESLLKAVSNGDTTEVEGIKLSKVTVIQIMMKHGKMILFLQLIKMVKIMKLNILIL